MENKTKKQGLVPTTDTGEYWCINIADSVNSLSLMAT